MPLRVHLMILVSCLGSVLFWFTSYTGCRKRKSQSVIFDRAPPAFIASAGGRALAPSLLNGPKDEGDVHFIQLSSLSRKIAMRDGTVRDPPGIGLWVDPESDLIMYVRSMKYARRRRWRVTVMRVVNNLCTLFSATP
jgi:hypothetical protein